MKNALIPLVTLVGIQIGVIIEGAIVTESVFSWPGVGRLVVASIGGRDYPVVQAVVLVGALAYMFSSLVVDILYAWLDPRISFAGRQT
jgi:ABC-type dipeptide/oligopeptide/nickel transport system permease component